MSRSASLSAAAVRRRSRLAEELTGGPRSCGSPQTRRSQSNTRARAASGRVPELWALDEMRHAKGWALRLREDPAEAQCECEGVCGFVRLGELFEKPFHSAR